MEKDVREMKVKRWRQKAVDREEWEFVIKEAKAMREPYSRGVSKHVALTAERKAFLKISEN